MMNLSTNETGESEMPKTIKTAISKRGIKFALTQKGETFGVYKLCENYAAHCKGGMSQTWRYIEIGMTREAAETLFSRRIK
jgi:hypothetical protein